MQLNLLTPNFLTRAVSKKTVLTLIAHGANVNQQIGSHGSPIQAASLVSNQDILKIWLTAGAVVNDKNPRSPYGNELQTAVKWGTLSTKQILLEQGALPALISEMPETAVDKNGRNPLEIAVEIRDPEVVSKLLVATAPFSLSERMF